MSSLAAAPQHVATSGASPSDIGAVSETPLHKVVARGFSEQPLPLALDRRLELRGRRCLSPDRMLSLPLNWASDLIGHVAQACWDQSSQSRPWFWMPPTALSGGSGVGRTHIGRTLARHAGVPFAVMDARNASGAARTASGAGSPDVAVPSAIVLAMASSGCANPIILVTGIDDATQEEAEAIASMIAQESAPRWVDEAIEAVVDLSDVSWLIQTDAQALPPSFPAEMSVIDLTKPNRVQAPLLAFSLIAEVAADLELRPDRLEHIFEYAVDYVRSCGCASVEELHRVVLQAMVQYERIRE
jgi:hypothetical protein